MTSGGFERLEQARREQIKGNHGKARKLLEALLKSKPDFDEAWVVLGVANHKAGLLDNAFYCFNRVADKLKDDFECNMAMGELFLDVNKSPQILAEMKARVRLARTSSALFNPEKMARSLGDAFVGMYEKTMGSILKKGLFYSYEDSCLLAGSIAKTQNVVKGQKPVWIDIGRGNGELVFGARACGYETLGMDYRKPMVDSVRQTQGKAV